MDKPIVYEGQEYTRIKDVSEKTEKVSTYDKDGKLAWQWQVDYEITIVNDLAVFTYWNMRQTYLRKESLTKIANPIYSRLATTSGMRFKTFHSHPELHRASILTRG